MVIVAQVILVIEVVVIVVIGNRGLPLPTVRLDFGDVQIPEFHGIVL